MELITVEEFKDHSRIFHDDEDSEIAGKVSAANEYVSGLLSLTEEEIAVYAVPADLKQATLLIAAHWFENRENSFSGQINDIPLDAREILINHRRFAF